MLCSLEKKVWQVPVKNKFESLTDNHDEAMEHEDVVEVSVKKRNHYLQEKPTEAST
jgi:hypothetical protein